MTKFKVGDIVRVKSMNADYSGDFATKADMEAMIGKVGTIIEIFTFEFSGHETAYQIQLPKNGIFCNIIDIVEQDLILN